MNHCGNRVDTTDNRVPQGIIPGANKASEEILIRHGNTRANATVAELG